MQIKLKQWKWDPMPSYNGFSNEERIRGWQVQGYLIEKGALPHLSTLHCKVCGGTVKCQYHLEDYYDPLNKGIPLCWSHHMMLHRRFKKPDTWQSHLQKHRQEIAHWESILSTDADEDWASPQVAEYGDEVRTSAFFLPDDLKRDFPFDQLHLL